MSETQFLVIGEDVNVIDKNKQFNAAMESWYNESISILSDYIRICYHVINSTTVAPYWANRAHQEAERVELLQDEMFIDGPMNSFIVHRVNIDKIRNKLYRREFYSDLIRNLVI